MKNKSKIIGIVALVVLACTLMAVVETIIEPTYAVKSAIKVVLFFALPILVLKSFKQKPFESFAAIKKKQVLFLLCLGLIVYAVIMGAYFVARGFFDFSALVSSLSSDQNVSPNSFIYVAAYISFGNSLLEEFMFRLVSFLVLSKFVPKWAAYLFSSLSFALYHIAMIGASFPLPLVILSVVGLAVGGALFCLVDDRNKNIYNSWIIHMFADFAIMTIWFIHI